MCCDENIASLTAQRSEHVARVCSSVIWHLDTLARHTRNLAPVRRALINRRLLAHAFLQDAQRLTAARNYGDTHGRQWITCSVQWKRRDPAARWFVETVDGGRGQSRCGQSEFREGFLMSVCGSQKPKKVFLTFNPQARSSRGDQPLAKQPKTPPFVHPVR